MAQYRDDPRWITARFDGLCLKCGKGFKRGESVWFYPAKRYERRGRPYCESCGTPMAAEFRAAAEDEDFLMAQFRGGYDERR